MILLGLDIAGASTGYSVVEGRTLVDWGKYVSNLKKCRGERLYDFSNWVGKLLEEHRPNIVLIEKPFLGRNSNVIASISKFIAVAELQMFSVLDLCMEDEWFIDPRDVKKALKVRRPRGKKTARDKHEDNKKIMVQRINSLYGLQLKYTKGKSKKYNDDDTADAVALSHTWLEHN